MTFEENAANIANHKITASHFEAAAKMHLEAAKYHTMGDHLMANECVIRAHGHTANALEYQALDLKHYTKTI